MGREFKLGVPESTSPMKRLLRYVERRRNGNVLLDGRKSQGEPKSLLPSGKGTSGVSGYVLKSGSLNQLASTLSDKGLGYGPAGLGIGGVVVQAPLKTSPVTINTLSGQIIMAPAALGGGATVTFTVNNTQVVATDCIVINQNGATAGGYKMEITLVAAGSFNISLTNTVAGAGILAEPVPINFYVCKAVNS